MNEIISNEFHHKLSTGKFEKIIRLMNKQGFLCILPKISS